MHKDLKIVVTGAGGYVGGWIVESLYLQGFRNVRAGVRRWSSAARIGRFPIEISICDVLDERQVEATIAGSDLVVHCAYGSYAATVKGTENVLASALRNRVKRLVHLSTVSVYGNAEGEVDETIPFQVTGSEYGDSKIEAEKLCWDYAKKGLPLVVLRPSAVYGPYDKLWVTKFAERLQSGQWGVFKNLGDGQCNLIFIQDLVRAVMISLESEKAIGQVFNVNGKDNLSWNDYFRKFNDALGLPPLQMISPSKAKFASEFFAPVKSTARFILDHYGDFVSGLYQRYDFVQKMMKKAEQKMKTSPGNEELSMFGQKVHYSVSKAESILGFTPSFDVDRGLALSVEWLKHEFLLNA